MRDSELMSLYAIGNLCFKSFGNWKLRAGKEGEARRGFPMARCFLPVITTSLSDPFVFSVQVPMTSID